VIATPQQYSEALALFPSGQAVMDDLAQRFAGPLWHADDAERARRIGQREVLEHIWAQISKVEPNGR
jgi:hypothetical protein